MISSPSLTVIDFKASAILDLSYESIPFNNSTLERNSSYFSLFLAAASLTIWLNVYLSNPKHTAGVLALIEAALGAL